MLPFIFQCHFGPYLEYRSNIKRKMYLKRGDINFAIGKSNYIKIKFSIMIMIKGFLNLKRM